MRTRGLPTLQGKAEENRGCQLQTGTHCGPERGLCHLICVLHRRLTERMRTFTCTKQLKAGSSFPPTLMGFLNVGFHTLQVSCARVWESAGSPFCHSREEGSAEALVPFYSDGWIYTFLQISGPFGEDDSGTFLVQWMRLLSSDKSQVCNFY